MKNKELLINALNTLFWSFGSEPPPEVVWGANELLVWIENEYNVKFKNHFTEDPSTLNDDFNKVIKEIESM
jgi:hypothetical protein